MKLKALLFCFSFILAMSSCIKDEALNAEADILTCTVPGDVLNRDPIIENEKITLIIKKGTDITQLAPKFTLTPGATILPESGTLLDFTEPQYYLVTSEDKKWQKKYQVQVSISGITRTTYSFENVKLDSKGQFQIFYETNSQGKEDMEWASGNPGYSLTGVKVGPEGYPTYQSTEGYVDKCLTLTTRETGSLGEWVHMPIAAGNLFLGTFNVMDALNSALKATHFGVPFDYIPTSFSGYYKYKAGDTFYESDENKKLRPVPGKKDMCDIYAVFYETDKNLNTLDGTNVLAEDNPYIVSVARIEDAHETDTWTRFNLEFKYRPGKTVDSEKLKSGKYNLAIVFSSSIRGAYFEGAPGSTLNIDEVVLSYE